MRKELETEIKVGIFISIGLILVMTAILLLGGTDGLFTRKNDYHAKFASVDGLISGAKVILGGVPVGTVDKISFDHKQRKVVVGLSVAKSSSDWIREDSSVEIATQGVLGDKYININIGSETLPVLPPQSEIPTVQGRDISQFINKGDELLNSLNTIAVSFQKIMNGFESGKRSEHFFEGISATAINLSSATRKMDKELDKIEIKKAVNHLAQILEKVDHGSGTLGALINDPGLYDEIKALFGGVNRNRIMRNLVRQAIRDNQTQSTPASQTPEVINE